MRRLSPIALSVAALIVVTTFAYVQGRWYLTANAGSRSSTEQASRSVVGSAQTHASHITSTPAYVYSTLKLATGFVLARAPEGSSGQPLSAPQVVASFGNNFGSAPSDSVLSMQLSPDGRYLAINAAQDHGEQVWIFDTQTMKLNLLPANVFGNFLNWMPGGHTFLYRPMFPLGPDAPMINGDWNPGLWEVDASSGSFKNIDIQMPSAFLVDAAASPDGSRIVYSTSQGLGLGSTVWMMHNDGSAMTRLFSLYGQPQSIAAMFAWSPNGSSIAYELLADSATPFLPAGLWVMNGDGGHARYLADTDGGHGFRLAWSPDSSKIAFVVRTNESNRQADALAQSLQCAVSVVDVATARSWVVASPAQTGMQLNFAPAWMGNGSSLTFIAANPFNTRIGGTPRYWSASIGSPSIHPNVRPTTGSFAHIVALSQ